MNRQSNGVIIPLQSGRRGIANQQPKPASLKYFKAVNSGLLWNIIYFLRTEHGSSGHRPRIVTSIASPGRTQDFEGWTKSSERPSYTDYRHVTRDDIISSFINYYLGTASRLGEGPQTTCAVFTRGGSRIWSYATESTDGWNRSMSNSGKRRLLYDGYNYDSISIRRPFDGHSTAYQRSSQWRNPLPAVTLSYLFI